jgi:hypothetical protein
MWPVRSSTLPGATLHKTRIGQQRRKLKGSVRTDAM